MTKESKNESGTVTIPGDGKKICNTNYVLVEGETHNDTEIPTASRKPSQRNAKLCESAKRKKHNSNVHNLLVEGESSHGKEKAPLETNKVSRKASERNVEHLSADSTTPRNEPISQPKKRKTVNWKTYSEVCDRDDKLTRIAEELNLPIEGMNGYGAKVLERLRAYEETEAEISARSSDDNAGGVRSVPNKVTAQLQPLPRVPRLLPQNHESFFNVGSTSSNQSNYKGKAICTDDQNGSNIPQPLQNWGPPSYMVHQISKKTQVTQVLEPPQPQAKSIPPATRFQESVDLASPAYWQGFILKKYLPIVGLHMAMIAAVMTSLQTTTQSLLAAEFTTATHEPNPVLLPPTASDTTGSRAKRKKPPRFDDFDV